MFWFEIGNGYIWRRLYNFNLRVFFKITIYKLSKELEPNIGKANVIVLKVVELITQYDHEIVNQIAIFKPIIS